MSLKRVIVYIKSDLSDWLPASFFRAAPPGAIFSWHNPDGYVKGQVDECDAILLADDHPKNAEIIEDHQGKEIDIFCIARNNPMEGQAYPVGFTGGGEFDWNILLKEFPQFQHGEPDKPGDDVLWYCPASQMASPENAPTPLPPQTNIAHYLRPGMFSDAPRVIVLGGGPSLKDLDPELLRGQVVIGCNRASEAFPSSMAITIDGRFHDWLLSGKIEKDESAASVAKQKWIDYKGLKIFSPNPGQLSPWDDLATLDRSEAPHPPTLDSIGLSTNTGHAAMMLAWALGAKSIWLFGFEMGVGPDGTQEHHHSAYPVEETEDVYIDKYIPEMERVAPALKEAGVKVTVFGPTALECFERKPIAAARQTFTRAKVRPLVVTFYTDDFYEAHAREMQKTAKAVGLDVEVAKLQDDGNWQKNTHKKAGFLLSRLRSMRESGGTRPLVWVDADARFRAYPTALDKFARSKTADLCVTYVDWDQIPEGRGSRRGRELLSGTLGLKPTDAVIELLERWVDKNEVTVETNIFAQKNIEALLAEEGCKVKVMELPMDHCQIFDSMGSLGAPVIEHMQASREAKR